MSSWLVFVESFLKLLIQFQIKIEPLCSPLKSQNTTKSIKDKNRLAIEKMTFEEVISMREDSQHLSHKSESDVSMGE